MFDGNNTTTPEKPPTGGINNSFLGGSLLGINILIIVLNALTILVIAKFRHKSAVDVFVMTLSIMDLIKGLIPVPISVIIYLTDWYLELGSFSCNFFGWIAFTTNSGSMLILTLMAVERFWAVVKPFSYKVHVTPKKIIYTSFTAILVTALHSSLPIFGVGRMLTYYKGAYSHFDYSRYSKGTIAYSYFVLTYGFAMIFIVMVSYSFVFYKIRNLIHRHRKMSMHQMPSGQLNLKTEKMFSYLTVALMLLFWFSWLPFLMVVLTSQLGFKPPHNHLDLIAMRIAVVNSILNPLVCALLCKPYRRGILYYIKKVFALVGYKNTESDVFDPWRRNSLASNRKNKQNYPIEDPAQQETNRWSSYDSGIATGEYCRTRLPSTLEPYDSYRKRINTTTSSINDDNSPETKRLGTLKENSSRKTSEENTPSQKPSVEATENCRLLVTVTDDEKQELTDICSSSSPVENERPKNSIGLKQIDININLLTPAQNEMTNDKSPNTKRRMMLEKFQNLFSPNKGNSPKTDIGKNNDQNNILTLQHDNYEKLKKIQKGNENANHLEIIQKDLDSFRKSQIDLQNTILNISQNNLSKSDHLKEHNENIIEDNISYSMDDALCIDGVVVETSVVDEPCADNTRDCFDSEARARYASDITPLASFYASEEVEEERSCKQEDSPFCRPRCSSDSAMSKPEKKSKSRTTSSTPYDESLVMIDQITKQLIDFSTSNLEIQKKNDDVFA